MNRRNHTSTMIAAVAVLSLCFHPLCAQQAYFEWDDGACLCNGLFDSTQYSRNQIQNTYFHLLMAPTIQTKATARGIKDIGKQSIQDLDLECSARLSQLDTAQFIETPYWERVREGRTHEIRAICELKRLTILGYANPDTLRSFLPAADTCRFYIDALTAGGEKMLTAWIKLKEQQKLRNANPERLAGEFERRYRSPEKLDYARLELMRFGWWNCGNHTVPRLNLNSESLGEFRKVFLSSSCACGDE